MISLSSFLYAKRDFTALYQKSSLPPKNNSSLTLSNNESDYVISLKNPLSNLSLGWRMYYQGTKITDKNGTFQFTGEKNPSEFHIVITHIKTPESHYIETLEIPENVPYKYYYLEKRNDLNNPENYKWLIREKSGDKGFMLPENTLIIVMDPLYIDTIENTTWKKNDNLIMLPTILLKKDIRLKTASIKSILTALDTDPFHRKTDEQLRKEKNIKVCYRG